eukprot:822903-Prorocentrum_minimum.AAC.1
MKVSRQGSLLWVVNLASADRAMRLEAMHTNVHSDGMFLAGKFKGEATFGDAELVRRTSGVAAGDEQVTDRL